MDGRTDGWTEEQMDGMHSMHGMHSMQGMHGMHVCVKIR